MGENGNVKIILFPKLTARPTAPSPKIATEEPFFGFATFRVAPKPVDTPQLRMQTLSNGAFGSILARQPSWITVYSLNVDVPRK